MLKEGVRDHSRVGAGLARTVPRRIDTEFFFHLLVGLLAKSIVL